MSHYGIWFHYPLTLVWSTPLGLPGRCGICTHQTFNKWHKKKKTLRILTHDAMWGCELTSLMICINDKFCDTRERNVTIRSEIWTTNIHSLGLRDIREWVMLWGLILWSLGCIFKFLHSNNNAVANIVLKNSPSFDCWQSCQGGCAPSIHSQVRPYFNGLGTLQVSMVKRAFCIELASCEGEATRHWKGRFQNEVW